MKVRKFNVADANLVRSPGQDGDIFVGNLVDEKDDGQSPSDTVVTVRDRA